MELALWSYVKNRTIALSGWNCYQVALPEHTTWGLNSSAVPSEKVANNKHEDGSK